MVRALYNWTMGLAARRSAPAWLAVVSFAESSVFPIPPDIMLLPMILAKRQAALRLALITTLASVAGAVAGYGIGALLWDWLGEPVIAFYGYEQTFEEFQGLFAAYGIFTVLVGALTPIPYKVVTIASGAFAFNLPVFILSSLLGRGLRFGLEALLLWRFGEPIRDFVEKRLALLTSLFLILLIGGFVLLGWGH